jgi:hypothetical protein
MDADSETQELVPLCDDHEYQGYVPKSACELCMLREEFVKLTAEVERLREQTRWVPCSERYPKSGQTVQVYFGNCSPPYQDVWRYDGFNQYFRAGKSRHPAEDVTHWQPIPAPPQ